MTLVSFSSTKDSSRLIYDAVWMVAHALHAVTSSGKWKNFSTDSSQISQNGDVILEHLKKASFKNETYSRMFFCETNIVFNVLSLKNCLIISGGISRNNRSHTV